MATGSPLPALKEMGHVEPTVTGAVKVVLLNMIADWASAELASAVRRIGEYIAQNETFAIVVVLPNESRNIKRIEWYERVHQTSDCFDFVYSLQYCRTGGRNGIG